MARTYCPECDEGIVLGKDVKVGLKLICPHCDAELEVIGTEPLELDWAYDWSWEEEEEISQQQHNQDQPLRLWPAGHHPQGKIFSERSSPRFIFHSPWGSAFLCVAGGPAGSATGEGWPWRLSFSHPAVSSKLLFEAIEHEYKQRGEVRMAFAYCLNCGGRINLGRRPWIGQPAFCERCGADLEVIETNPLEIEWSDNLVDLDLEEDLELESVPA